MLHLFMGYKSGSGFSYKTHDFCNKCKTWFEKGQYKRCPKCPYSQLRVKARNSRSRINRDVARI
jgi:hypothetical protein